MRRSLYALAVLATLSGVSAAMAQQAAVPGPAIVTFNDLASMPGLTDASQKNLFKVGIVDAQTDITFSVSCTAGGSSLIMFHHDKVCAVSGTGAVINPNDKTEIPRTQYLGGYDVGANGVAAGSGLAMNYLALGNAPSSSTQFSGNMHLKASLNSEGLNAIEQAVSLKLGLGSDAAATIDKRLDTATVDGLFIPSAGWPSDKGCTWDGSMVFAYQTSSWFIDLSGSCNGAKYDLKGNMPWTATKGADNQMQYDLNLTLPNAKATGDDAMFAAGDGTDLFATVPGIKGQILQKNSQMVTIQVDGQDTTTPSHVEATGTLTGTQVPLPVVRSLAVLFGLLSDNLFGA